MGEPIPVNPREGQVAIRWSRPTSGYVVGRLSSRSLCWVEEHLDKPIDEIYAEFQRRMVRTGDTIIPVRVAAAVIWAGIEAERRRQHGPLPEYSIDDAYEIVDEVGLDDAAGYTLALIQLSLPFRKRAEEIEQAFAEAGEESPMDPLRAAAVAAAQPSTGEPSSTPPSEPASPTPGA